MTAFAGVDGWLDLGDASGAIAAARARHRERDLALVAELADSAAEGTAESVLHRASLVAPALLAAAPACAGIHARQSPAFAAYAAAAGIEALATAGETGEAHVPATDRVYLPLHRLLVELPERGELTLVARPGAIGVEAGSLRLTLDLPGRVPGRPEPRLLDLPLVAHDPFLTSLCPERSAVRAEPATADQLADATTAVSLLRAAVPEVYAEMRHGRLTLVPLRPDPLDARESFSISEAGDIVYTNLIDPFETLDLVVHEYHHLRLFLLEEAAPLMVSGRAPVLAPWRPDTRMTRGLAHGMYVFWFVARVFERVFASWPPSRRGVRRLAIWRGCLNAAFELLDGADDAPTPTGARLLDVMRAENADAWRRLEETYPDLVREAEGLVAAHLAQAGRPDSRDPDFLGA